MRVAYFTRSHDGYRDNAPARDGDDEDAKAARLHLMMEPTDSLTLLLTAELTKLGGTGPAVYGSPLVFDSSGDVVHDRPPLPIGAKSWSLGLPSGFMDATVKAFRWKLDYDLAFALEHPGNAALFAEIPAVLAEHVADIADGSIAVIGGNHDQNGGATRAVSFKHHLVDLAAFELACAPHDGLLDVVGRHADSFGGGDRRPETGIHIGIATGAGGDHDLFDNARETFSALCVEGGFFVLDCRPLGMT